MMNVARCLLGVWMAWLSIGLACADYPDKPITLVVPYAPGGMGSTFGNLMSEALSPALGQRVIADYRPGANGGLGAALVAKAARDGYTLLMAVNSTMTINPALYPKLQYDPLKDFAPVAMIYTSSNVLMVNAKSPFKTVRDLVDYAKANPGKLNFGSSGNGATPHLSGAMFAKTAGIKINHVPYKGISPAVMDLLGGQIDFVFGDTSLLSQVSAGNLRALAVTGPNRLGVAPTLPTMEELGFEGFVIRSWYSIAAPAGTPKAVIDRLNAEITKLVHSPRMQQRMKDVGVDPAEDTSVSYLDATTRADLVMWKKFIAASDIKID